MKTIDNINQEIQEFKAQFSEYEVKKIVESGLNLEQKGRNKYLCPNGHDYKTPSFSYDPDGKYFKCFGECGEVIDIYEYYKKYENMKHADIMKIKNIKGMTNIMNNTKVKKEEDSEKGFFPNPSFSDISIEITTTCVNYIKSRGISQETVEYFNIKTIIDKFSNELIAFTFANCYSDDYDIVGIKLRPSRKIKEGEDKTWCVDGSKEALRHFFFNQQCFDTNEIYITEGEFDCMCVWECGYRNVISVPLGSQPSNEFMNNTKKYLDKYKTIVILSDNDAAGKKMDELFKKHYGNKVVIADKKLMKGKDINEIYYKYGKEAIDLLIKSTKKRISGHKELSAIDFYDDFEDDGTIYMSTGFPTLDDKMNGLATGYVTIVSGKTNCGKSTFVEQIQNSVINDGYGVLRVDGEHSDRNIQLSMYTKIIGNDESKYELVKVNRKSKKRPKREIINQLNKWHKGKFHIYNNDSDNTMNEFMKNVSYLVETESISLVIIDNMMSLVDKYGSNGDLNSKQSEFVEMCRKLATKYNVHVVIINHFNKSGNDAENPSLNAINGSSNQANKADYVIFVSRENDNQTISTRFGDFKINGTIALKKNRPEDGVLADWISGDKYSECDERIKVTYNKNTGSIHEIGEYGVFVQKFNYERYEYENKPKNVIEKYVETLPKQEQDRFFETVIVGGDESDLPY